MILITLNGGDELNPRPKRNAAQTFSICHWNLNSTCAHNFAKLSLLRAYVSIHKFYIICLSETYLDSSIDDESLEISGYYLIICGNSLCGTLELIFNGCLANGIFPSNRKKGNIVPVHKKNDKQRLKAHSQA